MPSYPWWFVERVLPGLPILYQWMFPYFPAIHWYESSFVQNLFKPIRNYVKITTLHIRTVPSFIVEKNGKLTQRCLAEFQTYQHENRRHNTENCLRHLASFIDLSRMFSIGNILEKNLLKLFCWEWDVH